MGVKVCQVSISYNATAIVVITSLRTFDQNHQLSDRTPIPNDTIVTLDPDTAEIKSSWGAGMFHVPHGITMDSKGTTYVTDTGLHQVMRVSSSFHFSVTLVLVLESPNLDSSS